MEKRIGILLIIFRFFLYLFTINNTYVFLWWLNAEQELTPVPFLGSFADSPMGNIFLDCHYE